jgi:large-conductance mechanosensitive channel
MNYPFDPANVNFGDPNAKPSNPVGTTALNIPQMPTQQQSHQSTQKKTNLGYFQKYDNFLNTKTGTILAAAIGMAIGFAFKDFVSSFVTNILQPLIIMILSVTHINNFYDFSSFISPQKNALNISTFFSSLFTFLFTIVTVYYIYIMLSTTL